MPKRQDKPFPSDGLRRADWSAYATAYDLLSEHNPAYQELVEDFTDFLATIPAPQVIYDIGGGTGNYTEVAANACPDSQIHLFEPDEAMIQTAMSKLAAHQNIKYEAIALEDMNDTGEADLVICVHALYAMPNQKQRLADLRGLLRPGGYLYLIDLGRTMNVSEWRGYLFSEMRKRHGLTGALQILWQGRQVAKQNKAIREAQESGAYWTHTDKEIATAATAAGFEIHHQKSVYRGYSDLLVCRAGP